MQDLPSDRDALQALLDFHVEAGADLALDETPHNRFVEPKTERAPAKATAQASASKASPASSAPSPRALPKAAASAPEEVAIMAREQARHAQSLEELEAILAGFDGCALKFSAKNLAFADGNPEGRVMLVGEAPGADEDRIGKPFMGRSGQLLDRMLATIGLDRTQVYVANIVPWRPPGNRTPTPQEIAICKPFIARQIELASPEIVLCLGGPAAQNLLGLKDGILRTRGRWYTYKTEDGREMKALPTLHPAYLLRQPLQKRLGWRDFQALRRALDGRE
ncbi:uracil-DNA glycosylase [Microvirga mediterraneensis]|uniref:Type-4 uracil-DNA glycosylase n=1 Tax=Microvirga mediterraneensis TaxID=2754695 RepID=A0A838BSB9_9HYPH|nr:uracil-DNA glycosylase [Microvirga mediterraneensis]MBA1158298.1 uracil-DNA glycosylase [Microvirga mediterraneensis]